MNQLRVNANDFALFVGIPQTVLAEPHIELFDRIVSYLVEILLRPILLFSRRSVDNPERELDCVQDSIRRLLGEQAVLKLVDMPAMVLMFSAKPEDAVFSRQA